MATWRERIDSPTPTEGYVPTDTIDAVTGMACSQWELSDEVTFSVTVPSTYVAASELVLETQESSPSTNLNHKWQAAVTLYRPADATTDTVTVTQQYGCGPSANGLFTRQFNLTSTGAVDATDVAAGDLINVVLTRIAASASEDTEEINMFELAVTFTVSAAVSLCSGRMATIINDVRWLFNDEEGDYIVSDATVVGWVNRCKDDLGVRGYSTKRDGLNFTADTATYDLFVALPDFVELIMVMDPDTGTAVHRCETIMDFEYLKQNYVEGNADFYVVYENTLEYYPVPTANESDALTVVYRSQDTDMGCTSNYTPPWPDAYDRLIAVNYCLWQAFSGDRRVGLSQNKAQEYQQIYLMEKAKLLQQAHGPQRLRPYR